ncbi:RHOMBOID-like protein 2, partial [Phalaenopsis equestris]|uniref:RHOMBOID-like protein 2 n=1 Tax=Phalaenopsis equestris TaxID=78828 RepID=UPI0009E557AD
MVLPPYFYNVPEMEERKWRAWFVPLIVFCNVMVMMVEMFVNKCPVHGGGRRSCVAGFLGRFSFQPIRENPLLGPSSLTLEKVGALQWEKIVHQHQWWRLLVSMWLHAGLIHLLVDILSLIFIGI